jgi:hypothetical protein
MKKIFFLAIIILSAGSVSAQRYFSGSRGDYSNYDFYQPKVGFEAGLNIANTINSTNSNYSTNTVAGFNAGITFDIPVIYPFSIEPEVLYSQKGYKADTQFGQFTKRTSFIDVPVLAKFRIAPVFNLFIGPQFSYLLSTTNTYSNGFSTTNQQYYNNDTKAYLDGVVGVSFDINRSIDLHARYTIDIEETDSNSNSYVPSYRNQVWQIGLGFKL